MSTLHALLLGAVQGATEFIPVSSTAHLFLVQELLGLRDYAIFLTFDLIVHIGTLLALVLVTRRELWAMLRELVRWTTRKPVVDAGARRMILPLIIGTVPGALAGFFLLPWITEVRSPTLIGTAMLAACAYFFLAEAVVSRRKNGKPETETTVSDGVVIGLAQAAAGVFAGLSRSGLTIATSMLRGLTREGAARFSFLLSIPIIAGAGLKGLLDLDGGTSVGTAQLVAGFLASAIVGYIAVEFLLRFLKHHTLRPFAIYLGLLGLFLITIL